MKRLRVWISPLKAESKEGMLNEKSPLSDHDWWRGERCRWRDSQHHHQQSSWLKREMKKGMVEKTRLVLEVSQPCEMDLDSKIYMYTDYKVLPYSHQTISHLLPGKENSSSPGKEAAENWKDNSCQADRPSKDLTTHTKAIGRQSRRNGIVEFPPSPPSFLSLFLSSNHQH